MTTSYLTNDIKLEEALRLVGYLDSEGVPTVGWGHTGPDIHVGMTITDAQASAWLQEDIAAAIHALDTKARWWWTLSDNRQDVLVQMVFQMGIGGFLKFTRTIAALQAGQWDRAADCMMDSKWAREDSPARAARMSAQMRSGLRAWAWKDGK